MDAGLLEIYGSDHNGVVFKNYDNAFELRLLTRSNQVRSISVQLPIDLPNKKSMLTIDGIGNIDFEDIPTNIDLSNYLKTDGSVDLDSTYNPTTDQSIATKKYVDDQVAGIGQGGTGTVDLTNYYTKAQSDTKYATKQELTGYLTTSAATLLYAQKSDIPDLNGYLTATNAANTYQPISGMSAYLTVSNAASTYQTIAGMSGYQTASPALQALASTWASDTSQNNLIPQRSGSTIRWVPLPDTTGFVTSAQLAGLLKADGSVPISATFTPTNDRDLVYKAWVEQKIQAASIGGGGGTPPDLSTYLLKTEAATLYQPLGSALTALQTSWVSTAADNLKIPQRQGNNIVWINLPDLSGYITEAAADQKYELSNVTLKKLVTWWSNAGNNEFPAKDPGTDRWVSKTLPDLSNYITVSQVQTDYLRKADAASTYLTVNNAASTYATKAEIPSLTTYLTKSEAASTYQPLGSALSALQASWASDNTQEGKIPQRLGNAISWVAMPTGGTGGTVDLTPYLTKTEATATYAQISQIPDVSGFYTKAEADGKYFIKSAFPELEAFATTSQSATNGYFPRKQGNTFSWVAANTLGLKILAKNESLTGDLVLTSSSEQYQFLNGGLLDRKVTLPTGATGLFFVIQNDGTKLINVHNDVNTLISTIYPKHITGFFWNGSNWAQSHTIDSSIAAKTSVNKQTLTADLILVPSSPVYQFLDPGTANRAVTLPAGFTGAQFIIQNTGTGTFSLLIKNSVGTPLLTTYARWTSLFEWNGTAWEFRQIQDASNVTIYGGTATLGSLVIGPTTTAGKRSIALTNNAGSFTIGATPTAARTVDFQDKDGIVALMSDIPDMTGYYTKTEVDNQFTVLQGTLPNMANYFTKTEANNQFAAKVQVDPIATRTAYLDNPVTAALPDTTITVGNLKALKIGTTYTVPNGNINKLFAITLPGILTSPSSYLHRLTEYNYLLTVNVVNGVGEKVEFEYFITWNPTQADSDAVGTGKFVAELIATSQSLSESTFHGRYVTVTTKITAPTLGIVNTQNGRLMVCSNSATTVQIVQENTAPGFEDSVFRNDTEIGLYALGGNVTVQVAAPCTLNDANTPIVINRYQMRVLKRFDVANKWYLI